METKIIFLDFRSHPEIRHTATEASSERLHDVRPHRVSATQVIGTNPIPPFQFKTSSNETCSVTYCIYQVLLCCSTCPPHLNHSNVDFA